MSASAPTRFLFAYNRAAWGLREGLAALMADGAALFIVKDPDVPLAGQSSFGQKSPRVHEHSFPSLIGGSEGGHSWTRVCSNSGPTTIQWGSNYVNTACHYRFRVSNLITSRQSDSYNLPGAGRSAKAEIGDV
jgi:hypothetical protein